MATRDTRSPDEIERDLADTRRHLETTLDALQARMSPGSLFEDALDYAKRDGGAFGRNFVETIRDNPVPATLVTIGLGWMMASGRSNGARHQYGALVPAGERQDHPSTTERVGAAASGTAAGARERLHDAGESLRAGRDATTRSASNAAHAVSDTARRGWDSTRDAVAGVGERMRGAGERSRAAGRSMAGFFEENPLAVGVMALAAGAALAAFLPRSRVEDETLGPLRDRAMEEGRARVGDLANEAAERTRVAAHVAAHPEKAESGRSDEDTSAKSASGGTAESRPSDTKGPEPRAAVRPESAATQPPARPTGAPPNIGSGPTTPPRSP